MAPCDARDLELHGVVEQAEQVVAHSLVPGAQTPAPALRGGVWPSCAPAGLQCVLPGRQAGQQEGSVSNARQVLPFLIWAKSVFNSAT